MKNVFSYLLIVITCACSLSGGGGSSYVVKSKVPQFCQKRCSGGLKPENMDADMHCATEALLDSNGSVLLEPLIQGVAAASDSSINNLNRLQKMINYFSAIATSNDDGRSKAIFIPNGKYYFGLADTASNQLELIVSGSNAIKNSLRTLKMKSYVTITGSDKGTFFKTRLFKTAIVFGEETNQVTITGSGVINLHLENFYIDISKNANNITINGSSFLLNTATLPTDANHSYIISIFGENIDITNNFFNIDAQYAGAAIIQGIDTSTSYKSVNENENMGYSCPDSPEYGTAQANTTCRFKYLGIMPDELEMPLNPKPGKTNKKVVELKEFVDSERKGDGTEVSCDVKWLSEDTSIVQTEANSSSGTKITLVPHKAGATKLSAKLKDSTVTISGPSSQNVTITGNFFGHLSRSKKHKSWNDKIKSTAKQFGWSLNYGGTKDANENFDTIWYAKDHYNTNFSNNFLYSIKSKPASSMIHSFNHCNLNIMKNYFGEWKNNTRELTLGNGKNINFHQNYLHFTAISAYKSKSDNQPSITNFYAYYNYFRSDNYVANDSDIKGFPENFIKNNWFFSKKKEDKNSNLHCTDNTCTGSIRTPSDTTNGMAFLSKNQRILLDNNATKEYPKKDGSINGPIKEPRVTNIICDPKYRRPKITPYPVLKRYTPLITKSTEKPCPTYAKEMEDNPDELCPSEKYNYCRKHFSDLSAKDDLELGKATPLTITVNDGSVGGSQVKEAPALTYGCEHPIGKNKEEKYLYLGANLRYGHETKASAVHISALNDFRDSTKKKKDTYNFFGTVYSGDMTQAHDHEKYQSSPYFDSIYGDIKGLKCFGLADTDLYENYLTYWLVRFLKADCFDMTHRATYDGWFWDDQDVGGSFAYKLEFDNFIVLQTNQVHWYKYEEDKHVGGTVYNYDWDFHEDRSKLKKWVSDAKKNKKEIIVLSVLPPEKFTPSFKKYLDNQNVIAYLYAADDNKKDTSQTATNCNNTDPCIIKIGATYDGTGIMLGIDKTNKKIQVYSIIESKFKHISRWFELDFKNH